MSDGPSLVGVKIRGWLTALWIRYLLVALGAFAVVPLVVGWIGAPFDLKVSDGIVLGTGLILLLEHGTAYPGGRGHSVVR